MRFVFFQLNKITADERREIEVKSREQADAKSWLAERSLHITASNTVKVAKATAWRNVDNLAAEMTSPTYFTSRPTEHGKLFEAVAVEKFEKMYGKSTLECGLFVSDNLPWLAATPDRIVDHNTVLEVKCPYSA